MNVPAFGTPLLVRAEIVRVIGTHEGDAYAFKQKVLDTRRYGRLPFTDNGAWPGAPIPADLAATPPGWIVEPSPNGNDFMRCRRIPLQTPVMAIYTGITRLHEGTLAASDAESSRPWRKRELRDRRALELYEVAMPPPTRKGRARLGLVHPYDVQVVPMSMTAM